MKLIILDRDGVINQDSDNFIKSVDEWEPIPGSIEAIARLHHAGYKIAVATNQSGIARGYYTEEVLHAMHDKFKGLLAEHEAIVDLILFCPHGPDSQCNCRKPKPGMMLHIANHFDTRLDDVYSVGDSLRDLQAGISAGAKPCLVLTGKGMKTRLQLNGLETPVFDNLASFVNHLLD